MGFPPKIGEAVFREHQKPEVLGEIKPTLGPKVSAWADPDSQTRIEMEESGPPPWEVEGMEDPSDARNFIECPKDWVLYWISPKCLDRDGWRGWKPVSPSDRRVKVKVPAMLSPENYIRRGGFGGDILGYMPRNWYESRKQLTIKRTREQTQASLDRMEQMREEFKRGKYTNITLESAQHPTHTMADLPRDLKD